MSDPAGIAGRSHEAHEFRSGDTLKRMTIKVSSQERVEAITPECLLECPHKKRPFFIGDLSHPLVGVATIQVDMQDLVFRWQPAQFFASSANPRTASVSACSLP